MKQTVLLIIAITASVFATPLETWHQVVEKQQQRQKQPFHQQTDIEATLVRNLSRGIYLIKINTENNQYTRRFLLN